VQVLRRAFICSAFSPAATAPPNPVGPTLVADKSGPDVVLRWTPPPADGSHDPASSFLVFGSSSCSTGFAEIAAPTGPSWHDRDAAEAWSGTECYLVSAENAAGGSGEEPAP